MDATLENLVDSLLYEGYALFPYTPGSAKNATPTPFGIVYPPAYAERNPATFDHARLECVALAGPQAKLSGTLRFLQVAGERHEGVERRLELPPLPVKSLVRGEGMEFAYEGEERIEGRVRICAEQLDMVGERDMQAFKVRMCIHNTTSLKGQAAAVMERGEALRHSLLSTHLVTEISDGRFVTPLENEGSVGAAVQACSSENIWACLAGKQDEAVLGAPIVLPDHASMAPESLGNLFDNTEIEEALLLHVKVLSDDEREQIAGSDPAVREMLERADQATPEEIMNLHGRLAETDHFKPVTANGAGPADALAPATPAEPAFPEFSELPADPEGSSEPELGHQNPGEPEVTIDGATFRKGGKVMLRPGTDRDVYDKMLDGRMATIERIYRDYEDATHIAVTVDGSAEQELFRATGRYLFFKPHEVEAI